uniref:Pitrilysin family protein n=1 Tax=Roseihalotalea indica TaxID=2867963 RepID=A0AA49JCC9_9BACT|nr:pitrilysin family protein [Tunicatimonas sp. TK19036]
MIIDRSVPPPSQAVEEVKLAQAKTHFLSNGVPVHYIRAGKEPIIGIEILFPQAGVKHETEVGTSYFATKMLVEGTARRSAFAISNFVDSYGAFLQLSPGLDYASLEIYTLKKYTDALLNLLVELLTEASFPEDELNKLKAIQIQKIRVNNEKSSIVASKKIRSVLFGDNQPYGKTLTEEQVSQVSREDLIAFYQKNMASNWEIIVSGQVDEEVLTLLEKHIGTLAVEKRASQKQTDIWERQSSEKKHLVERKENLQSSLRIGIPLFTKDHPDYIPVRILNTVLGGYFGSRLMKNIREEKGLTYGIYSSIVNLQEAGYLVIGTDVKKEFTEQALTEIYHELAILRNRTIGEIELNTVKNYMAGRLLTSIDTPFALAEKFKSIYLHNLDYGYYNEYLRVINHIESEKLLEMANRYFDKQNWFEVVVGGYQ